MPRTVHYKASSVIYFEGDVGDKAYILREGEIVLTSTDLETGQEVHERIGKGEFFGVKSSVGRYPREETAMVLSDAEVLEFSASEFEGFLLKNPRVMMKMLKVLSRQLRRIHKRVQTLLAVSEEVNPEEGLFSICKYYIEKQQFSQAAYALGRYLAYYPDGVHVEEVKAALTRVQAAQARGGTGALSIPSPEPRKPSLSSAEKDFYEAESLFGQERYEEALASFTRIAEGSDQEDVRRRALFESGRCLMAMARYDEVIQHYSRFARDFSDAPETSEALFLIARAYEEKGDGARAGALYRKVLSLPGVSSEVVKKARKALRGLEERV
ncbi:cyclic nucleotide-binding domain-containing protein [Spirochaeta thermophila]|uniref:Cyclic nucleotide-binding protein n=1 Tax=Winmispira thermophila (strain ATCC 49972 / DSM 6192 / RI 19.B1) TaxID=665571 RepID=E0RRI2_WINT6|nr:cyclic nucleotide-binding domain-containing protein [Spirochaeta thermophila]ADN01683.1 cyclic nucleotide-binding protein [Spirochaeta thermophila DSM 6192]